MFGIRRLVNHVPCSPCASVLAVFPLHVSFKRIRNGRKSSPLACIAKTDRIMAQVFNLRKCLDTSQRKLSEDNYQGSRFTPVNDKKVKPAIGFC